MDVWGQDDGRSEGYPVMGEIGIASRGNIIPRESGQTSIGWLITKTMGKLTKETEQMSAGR
jgi:hypothetical protein